MNANLWPGFSATSACSAVKLALRVQAADLPRKQRILRKVILQSHKQFARPRLVFLAYVRDRQQNSREWRQILSVIRSDLQLSNPGLLVSGNSSQAYQPAHR